jgi:response regulator of citrate/malate metabolism
MSEEDDNRERVFLDVYLSSKGGGEVLSMLVAQASASDNIISDKKKLDSIRDYCKNKLLTKTLKECRNGCIIYLCKRSIEY